MAVLSATAFVRGRAARWIAAAGIAWSALLLVSPAIAQPEATREYQIKAVFLFNFAQFVDWPPAAFSDPQAPLIIGVLGDDPFGSFLDQTVRGEKVNARPLVVRRYRAVAEVDTCHILFICGSEAGRLENILASLKGRSVLTVGDMDGFAQRGGMIRFATENNRIRLRVNLAAAKAAQLTLSSKLLRPADIVEPGKD